MKTTAKQKIDRKYQLFDADAKLIGKLAVDIAKILRGKGKVSFTPNVDAGDFVVVINSDKIVVTRNKLEGKMYHKYSGYPGGLTSIKLKDQLVKDSRKVIKDAVYGMLCKNKLRNKMMARLLIYKDATHKHTINQVEK